MPQHLSDSEFQAVKNLSRLKKKVIIQKSDKDSSVVLVNKSDYIRHIEGILKDVNKFEKVSLKKEILNFAVNNEEHINNQLRSISKNGSFTEQQYKKVKAVGSNPRILYGLCKVHKILVYVCPPFRPNSSAIGTPTYKLGKYLVPKLTSITANEFSVKDSFCFAEEIVNQNSNFIMGSSDVDILFTNISLEKTISICCETLFKETDIYEGYSKSEFKTLLSLASKESYFFFNEVLYKQKDGVAMRSPLGPTLVNAFL